MPVTHPHTFVIIWGFPSVLQSVVFISVLHAASQRGRNFVDLSITLVVSPKCYSWFEQVNLYK